MNYVILEDISIQNTELVKTTLFSFENCNYVRILNFKITNLKLSQLSKFLEFRHVKSVYIENLIIENIIYSDES